MEIGKCANPECGKDFKRFNTLAKYCSYSCTPQKKVKLKECRRPECENQFRPTLSTDKYCSYNCYRLSEKSPKKPKKKKIKPQSDKLKKLTALYLKERVVFLERPENSFCRVFPNKRATEVHHKIGRGHEAFADQEAIDHNIPLLLDKRFWLPVSRDGHKQIEENPEWAKTMGFSEDRLKLRK